MKFRPSPHKAHQKIPRSHQPVPQPRVLSSPSPVPPPRVPARLLPIPPPRVHEIQPTTSATPHNYHLRHVRRPNQKYMQGSVNACIHISPSELCNRV